MKKYKATCKVIIDGEVHNDYTVLTSANNTYAAINQVENSFNEHEDLVDIHFKQVLDIVEL